MVFIPLSDDNPLRSIRFAWVNVSLIVANVLAFLLQNTEGAQASILAFALIPSELFQAHIFGAAPPTPQQPLQIPEGLTLLTYQFMHGDIFHLLSNMLFLWVFGDNIEDALGHAKYLLFYLLCGVAGGLVHAAMLPASPLPLIGASGAVAGVIGAYLLLHPRVLVWVLAFRIIPLHIRAAWVLGIWVATQVIMVLISPVDQVAWWAHIGGLAAGALLVVFMRRPGVPLFDRDMRPV